MYNSKEPKRFSISTRQGSVLDLVDRKSKPLRIVYGYEVDKFSNLTTAHGLIRLYQGNKKAKIFWTLIIGCSLAFFLVQCINSWAYFAQKPTSTNVRFVAQTNGSQFPAITICNYNPIRKSQLPKYNMSNDVLDYIIMAFLQVDDFIGNYNVSEVEDLHSKYEAYIQQNPEFSVNKFFMNAGYRCEDMFKKCTFAGLNMDCCKFATAVLTDMGKCFQFQNYSNHNALNRQYISGPYYGGFQTFINVEVNEYPVSIENNLYETGVRLIIHTPNTHASAASDGLSCSPNNKLYAGVTQTHYLLLPPEQWGECKNKWSSSDFNISSHSGKDYKALQNSTATKFALSDYSTASCEMACLAQHFIQDCNCLPIRYFTRATSHIPICDPMQYRNCSRFLSNREDSNYLQKICPMCGIECERWTYNVETSYMKVPSPASTKTLERYLNMSLFEMKKNLVVLNTYLTDVNYVEYQQTQATSLTATLSAVGGNMGLFLGCSMITCFEIIVFLIKVCCASCFPHRRNRVQSKVNMSKRLSADNLSSSRNDLSNISKVNFQISDDVSMNDLDVEATINQGRKMESVFRKLKFLYINRLHDKVRSNSVEPIVERDAPISVISLS